MQLVYVYTILKIRLIDVNGLKKFYMNNLFISIKRLWKPPPQKKKKKKKHIYKYKNIYYKSSRNLKW